MSKLFLPPSTLPLHQTNHHALASACTAVRLNREVSLTTAEPICVMSDCTIWKLTVTDLTNGRKWLVSTLAITRSHYDLEAKRKEWLESMCKALGLPYFGTDVTPTGRRVLTRDPAAAKLHPAGRGLRVA